MKILKCDLCEVTTAGETFEAWMQALMPHYMEAHADVVKGKPGLTEDERKTEYQKWMVENKVRFETA